VPLKAAGRAGAAAMGVWDRMVTKWHFSLDLFADEEE